MNNRQLSFVDLISIMSFLIGLMNLDENVTQGDKQDLMQELSNKTDFLLAEIHRHLEQQDKNLQWIMEVLNENHQKDFKSDI